MLECIFKHQIYCDIESNVTPHLFLRVFSSVFIAILMFPIVIKSAMLFIVSVLYHKIIVKS